MTRAAAALTQVSSNEKDCLVLDELHWRIIPVISLVQPLAPDRGYLFWPATIGDDPTAVTKAVRKLIEEMRRASSGPAVASDAML